MTDGESTTSPRQHMLARGIPRLLLRLVLLFCACALACVGQTSFVYVTDTGTTGGISAYFANPTSGALTPVPGSPFAVGGAGGDGIVVAPNQRFAYVSSANTISAYAINSATGVLTSISGSPFSIGATPNGLVVDPSGRFLYAVCATAVVAGFTIDQSTGALTNIVGSPFATTGSASGFFGAVDPQGKFLYVASNVSGNISAFAINNLSGALTPLVGSPFSAGINLSWIGVHPTGKFLYVNDFGFGGGSAFGYTINPTSGALGRIPGQVAVSQAPHGSAIHPNGHFLYVSGEYTNGILAYSIDATSGQLSLLSGSPFPGGFFPALLGTDSTGRFLFAPNLFNNNVSAYAINPNTGSLTAAPGSPFLTGSNPYAVAVANGGSVPVTISPNHGGNAGNVTMSLTGSGFQSGAIVKLTGIGSDIVGTNTTVPNGFFLTTTWDLMGATPGVRNVVVTNPDNTTTTLTSGFTVEQGGAAQISVDIIGRQQIRIGTEQTYYIMLANSGNVDAAPGLVSLTVPSTVQYGQTSGTNLFVAGSTPDPEFGIPSTTPSSGNQNLLFASPGVPAGQTTPAPVQLTLPSGAPSSFTLQGAWQQDLANLTLDQFLGLENIPFISFPPSGCPACLSQYNAELLAYSNVADAYLAYENAKSSADLGFVQTAAAIGTTVAEAYLIESLGLPTLGAVGVGALIAVADTCVSKLFDDQSCLPNLEQTVKLAETGARDCLAGSPNCFGGKPLPKNLVDDLGALIKYFDAAITAMDGFGSEEEEIGAEKAAYGGLQQSLGPYRLARAAYQACLSPTTCGGPPPPPPPITPPGTISLPVTGVQSLDPNVKIGPVGVGSSAYVTSLARIGYSIYFDNQATATAPAQSVTVTDTLNTNLDMATLTLGPITFPNQVITPPSIPLSVAPFTTTVDLRPATNLLVKINASVNTTTSILIWTFQSLDPATNQPPTDPLAGFLPPGAEGSVFFTVMPKSTVTTGTVIQNTATVVFDVNPPINTPTWSNTIDNTKPTSHVNPLAATQATASFAVSWAGADAGAGVQDFTVYVSDNGAAFTAWQTNTPATSATFTGTVGHTYRFYSIARDLVGNLEISKSTAEATTTLIAPPTIQCTGCYFLITGIRATLAFNVASVGTASTFTYNYRTSAQTVQFASTTTSQIAVNGNTATFSGQGKLNGVAGYNFTVTAKDGGGVGSGLDTVSIAITGPSNYSYSVNGTIAGGDIVVKQ